MFSFGKDNAKGGDAILTNAVLTKATPNHSLCPSLDLKTRIRGFLMCLLLGSILGFSPVEYSQMQQKESQD